MSDHALWEHPQLAAQVLRQRRDGSSEVALRIPSLHDGRQLLWLEQRIRALPGVQYLAIDKAARRVRVVWDTRRTSLTTLLDQFALAQCPAEPLPHASIVDARAEETRDALKRLLVAGMLAMQVMTYAFVIYIGAVDFVDMSTRNLFRWLGLVTAAPLVLYSARPFFAGAMHELRQRRLGINLPVALAVALVSLASTINTLRGSGEIYFDSVSMFVFLLLAGRYLELRSRHHSGAMGDAVIDATPLLAQRRGSDGVLETVAAITLLAGDRVHIAEGGTVPADGVLESPAAQLDEALVSGESQPLTRRRGQRLLAGSVLLSGPIEMRVERSGAATTTARLSALTSQARHGRGQSSAGDREVASFVGRVLLLTVATAVAWLLIDPSAAFDAAVAVLVVACPCAFALTRPATLTRALGVLAQRGVLVTDSAALLTLARVDVALFDKTGTLSVPQLDLDAIAPLRGDSPQRVIELAASLSRESSHPLARAVSDAAQHMQARPRQPQALQVHAGAGISGQLDGQALRLGRADFALMPGSQPPAVSNTPFAATDALVLADAAGALALFPLREVPRPSARPMLDALRADGVHIVIASGDSAGRVASLAGTLHVNDWQARQSPADKLARLQAARRHGHVTLAVGDGSNDAPLLAGADVSAALASGTELAQAQADLLLLDGRLDGLIEARRIAAQVLQISAQSRRWAMLYNLCAVPFAAFGMVPPWLAGIGMSLSSLVVVLNALRVGRHAPTQPPRAPDPAPRPRELPA